MPQQPFTTSSSGLCVGHSPGRDAPYDSVCDRLLEKHEVYLDAVMVATPPEDYEARLTPLFPDTWRNLKLLALEAHDLALTKLESNFERDREDVRRLAPAGRLDREVLGAHY